MVTRKRPFDVAVPWSAFLPATLSGRARHCSVHGPLSFVECSSGAIKLRSNCEPCRWSTVQNMYALPDGELKMAADVISPLCGLLSSAEAHTVHEWLLTGSFCLEV